MKRHNYGKERLIVPTDFISPALSRNKQGDLVPPSHFASSVKSTGAHTCVQNPTSPPPISWVQPVFTSAPSGNPIPADPWLAITQAQQEILELRKENKRIMMLHGDSIREKNSADHLSDHSIRSTERREQWSRQESEWRIEAEKHKTEAERLKGQVEALKETAGRYREEMREKDISLSRHRHELELIHEELSTAKTELIQTREELNLNSAQKKKITSQFEKLKAESAEEITKLKRVAEKSKEESREFALKAEKNRLQTEEEAKQQTLRLSEQLVEMKNKQLAQLQQLNATHCAELDEARKTNSELQDRLQSMASEVLQLKSTLIEVSTEKDGLKEHLSQMGQSFETQSATLHSLRNYIGQLAPEKGEKERLNEAVEKLNKEKAALQMTTELLTVRLNSVNEILALQEEKIVKRALTDPLVRNRSESLQVLQLWREKVFKLCVQLRSKDIEIRREKDNLISEVRCMEQQLKEEQYRASVLQHSLYDRIAELDLEKVEKETLKQNLAKVHKENADLKSQSQKAEGHIKILTETVQRFSQEFHSKVTEVETAKARLNTFTQRLSFAKRRVETIQGLVMRRVALQKIEQACTQAEQHNDSITSLKIEHSLVCEERDKLAQELKRTPELIDKALSDLKEQYESKIRQQQQELEQCCLEVKLAVAGKEKAEQSLQHIQIQLEESYESLEGLRSEILNQQEHSEQALHERVSEIEDRCAEKRRELEVLVITARREHTKAVMTLRQFQKEARKQDEMKETQYLKSESAKQDALNKQLKEKEMVENPLPVIGTERREYTQAHTTLQNASAPGNQQKTLERKCSIETEAHLPAERLLCVLEELSTLSAAVVNSSEDSVEEDGWSDCLRPSDSLHS